MKSPPKRYSYLEGFFFSENDGVDYHGLLLFLEVRFGFYFFLLKLSDGQAFFTHPVRMFGISRTAELGAFDRIAAGTSRIAIKQTISKFSNI